MTLRSPGCALALVLASSLLSAQSAASVFDAPVLAAPEYSRFMNTLDFDGDGWMDALSTWYASSGTGTVEIQGWRNDQTGRLVQAWSLQLPLGSWSLGAVDTAAGDMNLDGRDDFVISIAGNLSLYLSNGLLPPTLWANAAAGGIAYAIVMADFNGDGRADIAAVSNVLTVIITNAVGPPFLTSSMGFGIVGNMYSLFVAEVNGDGVKDVGVAVASTGTQLRLFPIVNGLLQAPLAFTLPFEMHPMPAAGDIDGDGDEDIVVFSMTSYRVLRRTGPSAYTLEAYVTGGPATGLADVDQDGDLDGVCCGGGGNQSPQNIYTSVYEISINDGGVFAPAFEMTSLGSGRLAGAVDLDHDGDLDLVAGRCVYYPDGPITKSPLPSLGLATNSGLGVADVDRDGDPDLQPGVGAGFKRSNGDGTFASSQLLVPAAPAGTQWLGPGWPGDFDGDGDRDLVVVHQTAPGGVFIAMRLLLNNGGGGFTDGGNAAVAGADMRIVPSTPVTVQLGPDGGFVSDVDGDGDQDLIARAGQSYYAGCRIWLNSGGGFFTAGQELPGIYPVAVDLLDSDSIPDILGDHPTGVGAVGPLRVTRGLGGGTFAPADLFNITNLTARWDQTVVKDLDGDGDRDLIAVNGGTLRIHLNDGNAGFTSLTPSLLNLEYLPSVPHLVALTDVNADGYEDVVAGPVNLSGNFATGIRLGTATPLAFQPPYVQLFYGHTYADVDGDGDPDAIHNRLALNRRFRQPDAGLRRQYGAGLAGSGGMVPILGAVGPFRVGSSGQTRIRGGLGGAYAVFGIGVAEASVPVLGGTLLIDPVVTFDFYLNGAPGVPGAGNLGLDWTLQPWLAGSAFYQQVGIVDPGAPQGVSLTNGLLSVIGP